MIWLVEDKNLVAYAPTLKQTYSKGDITEKLDELANQIREIQHLASLKPVTHSPMSLRLIANSSSLHHYLEINEELQKNYSANVEKSLKLTFDVFENLVLYNFFSISLEDFQRNIKHQLQELGPFMSNDILLSIKNDAKAFVRFAQENSNKLNEMQKNLSTQGYTLSHNLFEEPDDATLENLQKMVKMYPNKPETIYYIPKVF